MTSPRRTHKWSHPICVFGDRTVTGCEQSERTCSHCGLIKITVHPPHGIPWREWRYPDDPKVQHKGEATPLCGEAVAEVPAL